MGSDLRIDSVLLAYVNFANPLPAHYMPTLQFKGKSSVWNHHLAIPYHTVEAVANLGYTPDLTPKTGEQTSLTTGNEPAPVLDNLLIEGDNLLALKALLPQFSGRVKCIYIDPPYNTGGENWVYNDNVNSPLINDWLGKVVGKDDLTRHDKWLCMMTPRLKLLRELLDDDGVIFISLDDNEQHHLRSLLDEMFGEENFVANTIWEKSDSPKMDSEYFSHSHDHLIIYAKDKSLFQLNQIDPEDDALEHYNKEDENGRKFYLKPLRAMGGQGETREARPKLYFPLTSPDDTLIYPKRKDGSDGAWRWKPEKVIKEKARIEWINGKNGWNPYFRIYADSAKAAPPQTIWYHKEVGSNRTSKTELNNLLGGTNTFDTPKPTGLIKKILSICTTDNDIILDSFAGSGTTGQAVMELNKEDGGSRRFILIQMPENSEKEPDKNICRDITRERLHRAIDKFGYRAGFQYWQVGQALDVETLLSGQLPAFETFARYVYYLCTGEKLPDTQTPNADTYLVGSTVDRAIYLVYQPDFLALTKLALNLSLAQQMQQAHQKKKIVVYAPACFLDDEHLEDWQIEFVGIPYNLFQRTA